MEKTEIRNILANYHTHSNFCDGKNSLQEIAKSAYDNGFHYLGFSSHSAFPLASDCEMHYEDFSKYRDEIQKLKTEYQDKMEILYGYEADFLPPVSLPDYSFYEELNPDYLIGAVHYVFNHDRPENGTLTVDNSPEIVQKGIDKVFGGDKKKMVQTYFAHQREMLKTCDFDIIGHIDLVRRRNGKLNIFSENDSWYKKELLATAKEIAKAGVVVEINTGGMARKDTTSPYPSVDFLKILKKLDVPILFSSDAHSVENLQFGFDIATAHAKSAGYTERCYLTLDGWKTIPLN